MRLKDLSTRTDLTLIQNAEDIQALKDAAPQFFTELCECDAFFVRTEYNGDYREVFGYVGHVPWNHRLVHEHRARWPITADDQRAMVAMVGNVNKLSDEDFDRELAFARGFGAWDALSQHWLDLLEFRARPQPARKDG